MGFKGSRLTVGDRILLLLIRYTRFRGELQAPIDVTQDGIANNLGIIRSAVPRAVGSLMNKGLVEENLAHINGLTRRRKVYMLTDEGIMRSRELSDRLSSIKIDVKDHEGDSNLKLGELQTEGKVNLKNISDVVATGKLDLTRSDEKVEVKTKGKTSYIHSLNPPEIFLGREREISEITTAIKSQKRKVTLIYGIAGVGKTTLGWKITQIFSKEMNIFYIDLKEWTTISYVLKEMASFLSQSGWDSLRTFLDTNKDIDIESACDIMRNIPEDLPALFIMDDLHRAPEEINMFLASLKERLPYMKNINLIVLSRKRASFYDIRDVRLSNLIGEMELLGFDRMTSKKLLFERGFKENEVDTIIDRTGGHPLALVLVEREGYNFDIGDFDQFLKEEIFNRLERNQMRVLGLLSLSRLQLGEDDLRNLMELDKDMIRKLMDNHLIFSTPGGYVIHDLIRDHSVRALTAEERVECHSLLARLFQDRLVNIGFHQDIGGEVPPYPFGIEDESGLGPAPLYVNEEIFHLIGSGKERETLPVFMEALLQVPSKDLIKEHREGLKEGLPKDLTEEERSELDLIELSWQIMEGENDEALRILERLEMIEHKDNEILKTIRSCAIIWKPFVEERVHGPENALRLLKKMDEESIPEKLKYYFQVTKASLMYKIGDHKGASKVYRSFLDSIVNNEDLPVQMKEAVRDALEKAESGSIQVATDNFQKIMDLTGSNRDILREELPYVDVDHHLLSAIYSLYHGSK
jgi:shikimate kinase